MMCKIYFCSEMVSYSKLVDSLMMGRTCTDYIKMLLDKFANEAGISDELRRAEIRRAFNSDLIRFMTCG